MQNLILKFRQKLYYFPETRLFIWKTENLEELQLP